MRLVPRKAPTVMLPYTMLSPPDQSPSSLSGMIRAIVHNSVQDICSPSPWAALYHRSEAAVPQPDSLGSDPGSSTHWALVSLHIYPPLTWLLRNLYAGQEATGRTGHRTTDWFKIGKGVHQGCILSPCFFNFYAEYIMRNAGLEEAQAGIKIAGRNINNLRYADDTTIMAESEEELKSLLMKVKEESEKAGLKLNIQETKIMTSGPITSWQIDRDKVETVRDYFGGLPNHCRQWLQPWNQKTLAPSKKSYDQPRQLIKKQRHHFANKRPSSQGYGFSSGHIWMWDLDY